MQAMQQTPWLRQTLLLGSITRAIDFVDVWVVALHEAIGVRKRCKAIPAIKLVGVRSGEHPAA
jgi:hypothetical protein